MLYQLLVWLFRATLFSGPGVALAIGITAWCLIEADWFVRAGFSIAIGAFCLGLWMLLLAAYWAITSSK